MTKEVKLNEEGKKILKLHREYLNNKDNSIISEALIEKVKRATTPALTETFVNKSEQALITHLGKLKKFQSTETDDFNEVVEQVKEELDKYKVKALVVADPKTMEIRIRRKFGMSAKDITEYFGVTDKRLKSDMLRNEGFLQTFMDTRVKKILKELSDEIAGGMIYETKSGKVGLRVDISNSYRHEDFKGMFNINYDVIIPKHVDAIEVLTLARMIIEDTVKRYKI